jgi:flagellar hook protein FlgE
MYSAISGMKAEQTKLDVIGNNIANVGTTAFKGSSVNFSDSIYQAMSSSSAPGTSSGGVNGKNVGLGTNVSSIDKLMNNGNKLSTGRTLDCDIDGNGYFIVNKGTIDEVQPVTKNAQGDNNAGAATTGTVSATYYTRNGNFSLDKDGNLLTSDGNRIMGYIPTQAAPTVTAGTSGSYIKLTAVDPNKVTPTYGTNLQPLVIPNSITSGANQVQVSSVSIGQDGVITATLADGTKSVLGQIAMASFTNTEGLTDVGGSYQTASANSGTAVISDSASVTTGSNSGSFGSINSGYLEASNVDLTQQFTDMISATRSFQAASKMISNGDEILQTITGLIR